MDDYIGVISMFPTSFAPRGWLFCDGQLLNPNEYVYDRNSRKDVKNPYYQLFKIIGTTYGGDGRTRFALPDMREFDKQFGYYEHHATSSFDYDWTKYSLRHMISVYGVYPQLR